MSKAGGISSGLDVNAIVTAMMDVEKISLARLDKSKANYELQLKNYSQVNSRINKFNDALTNLDPLLKTNSLKATSSDETVLSAVVSGDAESPGTHTIVTTQLATAHQMTSRACSAKNTPFGIVGGLSVTTGTQSFNLNIDPTDTLENIRDHINYSLDNQSITASILSTTAADGMTPEYRLVLTSQQTGSAQAIHLSGNGELALDLTHEITAAKDAVFTLDGFDVVRSSNTISDLMDGVTLTLNAANSSATLTLAPDMANREANVKKGVTAVVDAYNSLIDLIDRNQSTRATRDSTYSLIKLRLKNAMEQSLGSGQFKTRSWGL